MTWVVIGALAAVLLALAELKVLGFGAGIYAKSYYRHQHETQILISVHRGYSAVFVDSVQVDATPVASSDSNGTLGYELHLSPGIYPVSWRLNGQQYHGTIRKSTGMGVMYFGGRFGPLASLGSVAIADWRKG